MKTKRAPLTDDPYDVAVIGAGPAGSSAAAALARAGWRVALIERRRLPAHKVCGEFLSPESQATLHSLGLRNELGTLAPKPLTGATLTSERGTTLEMALPGTAWGLSRFAMDTTLANAAAARGADLLTETTATKVEYRKRNVSVLLRCVDGKRHICARTVLMAGGRGSTTKLPPAAPIRPREQLFVGLKSHVAGLNMPNRVELYLFAGGYVGINPVETGAANVCLLINYDAYSRAGRRLANLFEVIARQNRGFAQRMQAASPIEDTICAVGAVDTDRAAAPWVEMACLGDTATMIPPLCGDGMAMALRSAELCIPLADDYLRGKHSLNAWRDQYCAQWHQEFDSRLRMGRQLQRLLKHAISADALIMAGRLVPWLADYAVRTTRGAVTCLPDGD